MAEIVLPRLSLEDVGGLQQDVAVRDVATRGRTQLSYAQPAAER